MSKIYFRTLRKPSYILAAILIALLAGCALSSEYGEAEYQVDARKEALNLDCASNETPSCIERLGQPARCFCSSRDSLERILEDPLYEDRR